MVYGSEQIGKLLILVGIFIALAGVVLMILGRIGSFELPGDFVFSGKNWRIFLPIASSIIISIILTILIWLVNYFRK